MWNTSVYKRAKCFKGYADQEIFQMGVEEEHFERNMFVDAFINRINACTHKHQTNMHFQEDCLLLFDLFNNSFILNF